MGHPLRMYEASAWWLVTARCFQARKLMTPNTPQVREVCGGVLARAVEKYGVKVYAYAFLSNHLHLVVGARGPLLADFLKYLLGNLSRKLAPLCTTEWWGRFWERRASVAPILDVESLEDKVRYVLSHGVKEGLVEKATEWEGLHCAAQLLDGQPRSFTWYDWTKRWGAKGRAGFKAGAVVGRYDAEWGQAVTLHLSPLPHWQGKSPEEQLCLARALVQQEEARCAGRVVLGMEAVKRESAEPSRTRKRTPRPWCHAASKTDYGQYCRDYRVFSNAFRVAAAEWLEGNLRAMFPPGCFRPHLRRDIQVV